MNQTTRTVLFVLGVLLGAQSMAMLAPALVDWRNDEGAASAFMGAALFGLIVGGILTLMGRGGDKSLSARGAIILTGGSWAVLALFAAVPLVLADLNLSWTDALFEATSGITTTGATVLQDLEQMPRAVLLWRSILQWIGGVGIIVTAMAIWPLLGIGGMQLFRLESSDTSEKMMPRAGQIAGAVSLVYLALTFACFLAYLATNMNSFDALNHAMTTVATGGFSTHDDSIGHFASGGADIVALVFMVLAALPFLLYVRALGGRPVLLISDPQARAFLVVCLTAIGLLMVWLLMAKPETGSDLPAWRLAAVNAVSILTGTGYVSNDYWAWGGGAAAIFFVLMFIGGCAGSTTCSVKIFRYQIAASALNAYIAQYSRPHAVKPIRYRGKAVPDETVRSVLGFFFVFFGTFAVSASLLAMIGLDTVTAFSGAATTLANVGPGLGTEIGPASTFQGLPESAKWVMTANMLIGRLEVMTVLVMLAPGFWRR